MHREAQLPFPLIAILKNARPVRLNLEEPNQQCSQVAVVAV